MGYQRRSQFSSRPSREPLGTALNRNGNYSHIRFPLKLLARVHIFLNVRISFRRRSRAAALTITVSGENAQRRSAAGRR